MHESCSKNQNPAIPLNIGMKPDEAAMELDYRTFQNYYNRLKLLAINRYKWEGLPESCNALALEKWLYYFGRACFIEVPENVSEMESLISGNFINLKCTGSDTLNIYEMPIAYNCYSGNYEIELEAEKVFVIRNNALCIPTDSTIQLFAYKLATAERTIDTNIYGQRTPVLILCDEKQRLTLQNVYMRYDGHSPVIFGDKDLDLSGIKTFSTNAPFVADKIHEYKRNVWAEAMTFLGINNVDHEKKERLTEDEVNANNSLIENNCEIGLAWRQAAAEEANKRLWPGKYKATVSLRTETELKTIIERGGENGKIYNNNTET